MYNHALYLVYAAHHQRTYHKVHAMPVAILYVDVEAAVNITLQHYCNMLNKSFYAQNSIPSIWKSQICCSTF